MNWSVDWAWWNKDVRERQLSDRLQAFFESKGMTNYSDCFTLNGIPLNHDHSTGLVAMNAVASLAATNPRSKQFVEALWNTPVPTGQWRYYNGMLYMHGAACIAAASSGSGCHNETECFYEITDD